MNRPLFSILHTSARPEKWREIYDAWISTAAHPDQVEYVLCVDERWGFTHYSVGAISKRSNGPNMLVWNTSRRCYVDGANTAAKASTGRILIVSADDQYPCQCWDAQLIAVLEKHVGSQYGADPAKWPDGTFSTVASLWPEDFVIEVNTGTPSEHERSILVMPILSRGRYERIGYVFYPEYESMFADNDFCEHARQDGVIIDARHLLFPHRHPLFDESVRKPGIPWNLTDQAYAAQNRKEAFEIGQKIFMRRVSEGFQARMVSEEISDQPLLKAHETKGLDSSGKEVAESSQSGARPGRRASSFDWLRKAAAIQGWMTEPELIWLHDMAESMGSVAEIGSWKGRSTCALLAGCKGNVYAVDTFKGSNEPEHIAEIAKAPIYPQFLENVGHFPTLVPVTYPSVEAAKITPDVDMVFIDGAHDYESVKADLLAWKGKAQKLICGHDADYPDVAKAVREILGNVQRGPDGLWFQPTNESRRIVLCLPGQSYGRERHRQDILLGMHLKQLGFQAVGIVEEYTSDAHVTRQKILEGVKRLELNDQDLLLWIDDDNVLNNNLFDLLLQDLDARPDVDGVCGWCWIHDEHTKVFNVSCGEFTPDRTFWIPFNPRTFPKERQPRRHECGGFPCVLMRYAAIRKTGDNPFLPIVDSRMVYGRSGEDLAFWIRAEERGARFIVDPRAEVPHFRYMHAQPYFHDENAPVHTVACMMRVKNEARWITKAIESVKELCGEHIYVLEDGSADNTPGLITAAGAHMIPSPFAGEGLDECRDKDFLMRHVIDACHPDWILCIDGDEALEPGGCQKILNILKGNPKHDYIGFRFINLWNGFDQARVDGRYGSMVRQSLFRPSSELTFRSYYDHEGGKNHVGLHCGNTPYAPDFMAINVFLLHFGAVYKEDRIRKYRWMNSIDPENEFEDGYRHMVQGDIPEVPADARLKFGGPLEIRKLPRRLIVKFEQEPGPAKISGSAVEVSA